MRRSRCLPILAVAPVAAALIASQTAIASAVTSTVSAGTAPTATGPASTGPASTAPTAFAPLTWADAARLSQNVTTPVIVILKSQLAQAAVGTQAARTRADAVRTNQRPLLSELAEVHATHVQQYQLVNSLSATVSAGEEARLRTDPQVAQVIPDQTITLQAPPTAAPAALPGGTHAVPARTTSLKASVIPGACPKNQTQLAPEGLSLTNTASANSKAATARSLGFTGSGVTVGFIADGIDTQNVNFLRANGKSVFTDYRDFSGNGAGAPTSGDESFLDANTIAGQGLHTYNLNGLAAQSYPNACDVKIEGVAPGASLVGLDAISESPQDQLEVTTSNLIEAINYAVETDHVNVLNESFGVNQIPDLAADATREFDDAAVKAGVVVAVASGDSGSANTVASPASDPNVISAGASTQFQLYAQSNVGAARYFAPKGWLSDNISSLSSAGTDSAGGTVDLVAPGDLSADSCDAIGSLFSGCENFLGAASDISLAGGTSEAAPFVAGAAALVIQAYRKTHDGGMPSPALVKQILTSTATDLGTPADEQGAGLLNSYKAVEAAESYGNGTHTGQTLLASASQLNAIAAPGTPESWQLSVTNTGAQAQTVRMSGRAIGPDQQVQAGSVTLNDKTSDQFTDNTDEANNYQVFHFTVPSGRQRLDASIAWPGSQSLFSPVSLTLVDPAGRLAANSNPQGFGNFGNVDVRYPAAGTWTGVIYSPTSSDNGGFAGKVTWRVATEQFAAFGGVWPSSLTLAPGASGTFTFAVTTPSLPGDSAGSIVLNAGTGGTTSIPVTLRSMIPVTTSQAGTFSGVLTGGNGRPGAQAQENAYEFNVPSGVQSISAGLTLANDPSDAVGAFLVSPDGDTLGYGENGLTNPSSGSPESPGTSLAAYTLHPAAGTWTLELEFAQPVAGNEVSDPFTGSVAFNATKASSTGLPDSTATLSKAATATVTVTNTGKAPEQVFLDPRLDKEASYQEAPVSGSDKVTLPLTGPGPMWRVPAETSGIKDTESSTVPAMFDLQPATTGDPDLASHQAGTGALCASSAAVTYKPAGGEVTTGLWTAGPTECGPFKSAARAGSATSTFTVTTKAFDGTADGGGVSSPTGAFWYGPKFAPVTVQPGKSATITVTITPSDYAKGTLVTGDLYVEAYEGSVPALATSTIPSADEMSVLPYEFMAG